MNSILLLLLLLSLWASCHGETVHICPNEEEVELECIPFSKCLNGTAKCFSSHTVLLFQPGVYNITNDSGRHPVNVKNVVNLHLKGVWERNNEPETKIICQTEFSFMFTGVLSLNISGIAFVHCGAEIQLPVVKGQIRSFLDFKGTLRVALLFTNVTALNIENVHVNESNGVGFLAVNALGLRLTNSIFFRNNWLAAIDEFHLHEKNALDNFIASWDNFKGGNVVFLFTDTKYTKCKSKNPRKRYAIDVSNSTFAQGAHINHYDVYLPHHQVFQSRHNFTIGGGLSVVLSQGTYDLDIMIQNIASFQNFAYLGANLCIYVYDLVKNSTITVVNSSLSEGNALSPFRQLVYLTKASGLNYGYGFPSPPKFCKNRKRLPTEVQLIINNVTFTKNIAHFGAGLFTWDLNMGLKSLKCCHNVTIKNCTFIHNAALFGSAMYLYEDPRFAERALPHRITLENTLFKSNELLFGDDTGHLSQYNYLRSSKLQCTVTVEAVSHVTFTNCTFEGNEVTALFAVTSRIILKERNTFSNNNGTLGGAIALYDNSIFHLMPDSHLYITDNHAKILGGGIYVTSIANFYIDPLCFYQVEHDGDIFNQTALPPQIYMEGNTANIAGGTIYGGYVDSCVQVFAKNEDPLKTFHRVFNIVDVNLSAPQTEITSNPLGPCFCSVDGEPQCSESEINRTVFTGEVFNISVIGVGQLNGTTPAVIVSRIFLDDPYEADSVNDPHHPQYAQKLSNECQNITYHVHARKYAKIILLVEALNYRYFTRTINVHIRDCPLGFRLSNSAAQPICKCEPQLQDHCNQDNGTVTRSGTMWIGYFSNSTLFHKNCPFDYCKQEVLTIPLNESQKQCALNRVGILCGECREGLSLTLGTSQCKLCSNAFLGLLALFAFAGVVLVVVLYVCNLTVARGTINGLIFYANVIRINHAIFFPPMSTGSPAHIISQILTVFIAWLNLDLGIETCFYDGMNGYAKTWLQFVFPVYIWLLASFVIFASRYLSFLQKVSSNAVPVLATLFLLSYAKLQRTIITSLSCTWLNYKDRRDIVWLYNGNVQCFSGKHGLLALVAIAVAVFFILPVMLFLLFSRQLQARSTFSLLRWVNKLKPLLDAYHGPYKDTYRHWTGLILFVQNLLFAAFACNVAGSANVNCFTVAVIIVLLLPFGWKSGGIYKHSPKNFLECFFHINLGILAATSLYIRSNDKTNSQIYVSNVFIGTAFVVFIGILGFHTFQRVTEFPQSEKIVTKVSQLPAIRKLCLLVGYEGNSRKDLAEDAREEEHLYEMVITPQTRQSLASSTSLSNPSFSEELREPLLEEC